MNILLLGLSSDMLAGKRVKNNAHSPLCNVVNTLMRGLGLDLSVLAENKLYKE